MNLVWLSLGQMTENSTWFNSFEGNTAKEPAHRPLGVQFPLGLNADELLQFQSKYCRCKYSTRLGALRIVFSLDSVSLGCQSAAHVVDRVLRRSWLPFRFEREVLAGEPETREHSNSAHLSCGGGGWVLG